MNRFHVHVDALQLASDAEDYLVGELRFVKTPFVGHPEDALAFEPKHHLTIKPGTADEFRDLFEKTKIFLAGSNSFSGYIEGEWISCDLDFDAKPFDSSVPIPFRVVATPLPLGEFRQSEVHVTMDSERSDPRVIAALQSIGLFAAYLPKKYGRGIVFTGQGSREIVSTVLKGLTQYIENAGGAVACSIKEERIAKWWVSSPDVPLPPVVKRLEGLTLTET